MLCLFQTPNLEKLLNSAHAQTSILHLVQTITKCTQNIQVQNGFLVRLSFLWPNSDQKTTSKQLQNKLFGKIPWSEWVKDKLLR